MPKSLRGLRLLVILFTLFSTSVSQPSLASPAAQTEPDANVRIVTDEVTGLYNFIGIDTNVSNAALPGAAALQNGTPTAATALTDISIYAREFGLSNPTQELQFLKESSVPGGSRSFRYQQVYQGVPVIGGELIANYTRRGLLTALVGETSSGLSLSVTPRVAGDRATSQALGYVAKMEGVAVADLAASTPLLSIYDPHLLTPDNFDPSLVWRLEVRSINSKPIRYFVLVDATYGAITLAFNQIDTAWHHAGAAQVVRPVAASLPIVDAPQFAPNFGDPAGATYDSHHTTSLHDAGASTLVCNTSPTSLSGPGSCDGSIEVTYANAAHYFAYSTFDYYDLHHVRNSIDGLGMPLFSNVDYCESDPPNSICPGVYYNAFWDGEEMVYGDGTFFAADDVVGHELTHGVTQFSSNLIYLYESGAINEAMSDIFSEFIDQWNGAGDDSAGVKWLLGEDTGVGTIRNMANPPAFDQPDRTQSGLYFKDPNFGDNGGVHYNSGVANKAAYLLAQGGTFNGFTITALGATPQQSNDKVSALFYEVNNNLLTSGADFSVLRATMIQACNNLVAANTVGMTAANCIEVEEATRATEMQLDPVAAVVFRPQADFCPTSTQVENILFSDDLESGFANFTSDIVVGGNGLPEALAWQDALNSPVGPNDDDGLHSLFGASYPDMYGSIYNGDPTFPAYEAAAQLTNPLALPAGSTYYLHFDHNFALEFGYMVGSPVLHNFDGAVLEYELDGSNNWIDAGSLYEAGQNYNGIISSNFGNPLGGRNGFIKTSHGYVSTRYNLKTLAGHNVRFRWVVGSDVYSFLGWFVDDVQVYSCITQNAAPKFQYTTDTTPELTWAGTTYASKYEVEIANNAAFTGSDVYTVNLPALSFTIPVPLPPGTYYWRVRAYDGVTAKAYSPTVTIIIDP